MGELWRWNGHRTRSGSRDDERQIPPEAVADTQEDSISTRGRITLPFSAIAREVFESTPKEDRDLRDVIIQLVAKHADIFIQKDAWIGRMIPAIQNTFGGGISLSITNRRLGKWKCGIE
jgi:hypothetical protein